LPPSSAHALPTEDKQELQRRRLLMERSAPPGPDDAVVPGPSAPPVAEMQDMSVAPSAPVLDEDDEGLVGPVGPAGGSNVSGHQHHTARKPSEDLPVYQR
jgi:hypothetical protein